MPIIKRLPHALLVLVLLNACSEDMLRSNSSPAYADGYRDGCSNGTSTASNRNGILVRDDPRYLNDPEYARGWRSGDQECDGENLTHNPNDSMEPIQVDGPQGVYGR